MTLPLSAAEVNTTKVVLPLTRSIFSAASQKEKTNDLVFLAIEMRGITIQDKKKQEQDVSSSKNVVAVLWRCSNDPAQEKCAGLIEGGIYGDPRSKTASLEILLSPTKDEVTYCALPKVSFYSGYTLLK